MDHIILKLVEVANFKSYAGLQKIGPLSPFSIITGANGVGKSNLLDAISFAFGESFESLRITTFSDLVHGAVIGKPLYGDTSVTVVLEIKLGNSITEKCFTRTVSGDVCILRIDKKPVTLDQYMTELAKFQLNINANNFLVYQGKIETLASLHPEDLTEYLEHLSGSIKFKPEYSLLKKKSDKKQEAYQRLLKEKQALVKDYRFAKRNLCEADEYEKFSDQLVNLKLELALFRTYHANQNLVKLKKEEETLLQNIQSAVKATEEIRTLFQEKMQKFRKANNDIGYLEHSSNFKKAEKEVKMLKLMQTGSSYCYKQSKIKSAVRTLTAAKNEKITLQADLEQVQVELKNAEIYITQAKKEYDAANELLLGFTNEQKVEFEVEYNKLKMKSVTETKSLQQEKNTYEHNQDEIQTQLNYLRLEIESHTKPKENINRELLATTEKLKNLNIDKMELDLKVDSEDLEKFKVKIAKTSEELEQYQIEYNDVIEQLVCYKDDKWELKHLETQKNTMEQLTATFGGLHGRVRDLCKPIHESYKLCVTRALGHHLNSIIVESTSIARKCIAFLKEHQLGTETFLPLDNLVAPPFKEYPENVACKSVFEVLEFDKIKYGKVISFCTNNIVVCKTMEDAAKVAYGDEKTCRSAVSMDGSLYQPGGTMCGGSQNLQTKAKLWDAMKVLDLKTQRDHLQEELLIRRQKLRCKFELGIKEDEVEKKRSTLKLLKTQVGNLKHLQKTQEESERSVMKIMQELRKKEHSLMSTLAMETDKLKAITCQCDAVDDVIFADLCKRINIDNIRVYEYQKTQALKVYDEKMWQLRNQLNRATEIRNYLMGRVPSIEGNIERWSKELEDRQAVIVAVAAEHQVLTDSANAFAMELQQIKEDIAIKQAESEHCKMEAEKLRKELRAADTVAKDGGVRLNSVQLRLEEIKQQRYELLKQFSILGIEIPYVGEVNCTDFNSDGEPEEEEVSAQLSNLRKIIECGDNLEIDFSSLRKDFRQTMNEENAMLINQELAREIDVCKEKLLKIEAPNMRARQHLDTLRNQLCAVGNDCSQQRIEVLAILKEFDAVKLKRSECFQQYFDILQKNIDVITKELYNDQSAQAVLFAENPEEPYLSGIKYDCIPPSKGFQVMKKLSGGEHAMSAIALLFATHSVKAPPFMLIDELDASLDSFNLMWVAQYIKKHVQTVQVIAVTLNNTFASNADTLIGLWALQGTYAVRTQIVMLDMLPYHKEKNTRPNMRLGSQSDLEGIAETLEEENGDTESETSRVTGDGNDLRNDILIGGGGDFDDYDDLEIQKALETDESQGNVELQAQLMKQIEGLEKVRAENKSPVCPKTNSASQPKKTSHDHETTFKGKRVSSVPRNIVPVFRQTQRMPQENSDLAKERKRNENMKMLLGNVWDMDAFDEALSQRKKRSSKRSKSVEPHPSATEKLTSQKCASAGGKVHWVKKHQSKVRKSTKRRSLFGGDNNNECTQSDSVSGVHELPPSDDETAESLEVTGRNTSVISGKSNPNKSARFFFQVPEDSPTGKHESPKHATSKKKAATRSVEKVTSDSPFQSRERKHSKLGADRILSSSEEDDDEGASTPNPESGYSVAVELSDNNSQSDAETQSGEHGSVCKKYKSEDPIAADTPDSSESSTSITNRNLTLALINEQRKAVGSPPIVLSGRFRYVRPEESVLLLQSKSGQKKASTTEDAPYRPNAFWRPKPESTKKTQTKKRKIPSKKKPVKSGASLTLAYDSSSDSDVAIIGRTKKATRCLSDSESEVIVKEAQDSDYDTIFD